MVVDEDFVMGYACGYNDGIGSGGGGSGEPFSEIVIEKNYPFGDSGYGVATIDIKTSRLWAQDNIAQWAVENPGGLTPYRIVFGPVNSRHYKIGYAMTKNGKIIGYATGSQNIAHDDIEWSYETGEWVKISEDCPVIGKCSIVKTDDSTEYNEKYNILVDIDGTTTSTWLATRQMSSSGWDGSHWFGASPYLMDDTEYAAWRAAFIENGITL